MDWLVSAGQQIWQVLPLVPPEEQFWSPYSGQLRGHTEVRQELPLMSSMEHCECLSQHTVQGYLSLGCWLDSTSMQTSQVLPQVS